MLLVFSLMAIIGVVYQISASLMAGIGDIAQKPSFAHGGKLTIPYLLASHYFEHVLDSIFFTLLTLFLVYSAPRTKESISSFPD